MQEWIGMCVIPICSPRRLGWNSLRASSFPSVMLSACRHSDALLLLPTWEVTVSSCSLPAVLSAPDRASVGPFRAGTVRQLGTSLYLVMYLIILWTSASRVQERLFGIQMSVITLWGIRRLIALTTLALLTLRKQVSIWNLSCCTLSRNRNLQLPGAFSSLQNLQMVDFWNYFWIGSHASGNNVVLLKFKILLQCNAN